MEGFASSPPMCYIVLDSGAQLIRLVPWNGKLFLPLPDLARNLAIPSNRVPRPSVVHRIPELGSWLCCQPAEFGDCAFAERVLVDCVADDAALGAALRRIYALRLDAHAVPLTSWFCVVPLRRQIQQAREESARLQGLRVQATEDASIERALEHVVHALRREVRDGDVSKVRQVLCKEMESDVFCELVSKLVVL